MIDQIGIAIATGAAGNALAYLLNGRVDALRERVAGLFRAGGSSQQETILTRLDEENAFELGSGREFESDLRRKWTKLFTDLLVERPEMLDELRRFAATPATEKIVHIGSQSNTGSGTFIGGDNFGPIGGGR